jgi:caa(3)-type oxidase subunit IV
MTESHGATTALPHDAHAHAGPPVLAYVIVFAALSVFTAVSFIVNGIFHEPEHKLTGAVIILIVAIIKAVLVGLIFMHLKYDWARLYFLIIPVFILGVMMMMVLMPDIVFAWHHE